MRNGEIADAFEELASLYELDGAVVYRVVAYRNAAKAIREAGVSVAELARQGRVTELAGVGKTIAEKIDALLETGSIPVGGEAARAHPERADRDHEHPRPRAQARAPAARRARHRVARRPAPRRRGGQLGDVPGFGVKAQQNVLDALAAGHDGTPKPRLVLSKALAIGEALVEGLRPHATRVELAGSARRMADTCKDLDIVAATDDPQALVKAFAELPEVDVVSGPGIAGAKAITHAGLPVDLRIVPEATFGNLLQHFTGSGKHNEALRTAAVKRGLHVSEHGIVDDEAGETHACAEEAEVYERLGHAVHRAGAAREPRRAGGGEKARAAASWSSSTEIRGDLHSHTIASDGRNTIAEMATTARDHGYEYLADHRPLRHARLRQRRRSRTSCGARSSACERSRSRTSRC